MENFAVGVLSGIASSYFIWWIISKFFVPDIKFSPTLSKIDTSNENYKHKYRFKFKNSGIRNIIDIEIFAIMKVQGLRADRPNNSDIFHIPLFHNKVPYLEYGKSRTFTLILNKANDFDVSYIPNALREKLKNNTITLEDIYDIRENVFLQIHIFGYDEFSGSRKLFTSKKYTKEDIKFGFFMKGTMEISTKKSDAESETENT